MKKKTISILCSLALLSVLGGCRQENASQDNVSQTGSQTESENDTEAGKDPEVSAEDAASSPEASPEATDAPADTGSTKPAMTPPVRMSPLTARPAPPPFPFLPILPALSLSRFWNGRG